MVSILSCMIASTLLVSCSSTASFSSDVDVSGETTCPISPSDPWAHMDGCCCCTGKCLYAACPPCPCPSPTPGHAQPTCTYQQFMDDFKSKYAHVVATISESDYPAKTTANGQGKFTWGFSTGWTSGFFPGLLWQLGNHTADSLFSDAAAKWTAGREVEKTETTSHDIGFMVFGSFGNGIQLGSKNATYSDVVIEAAHSLAMRYNAKVGMTRSWGNIDDKDQFEVIIDNLMNLELLFWAAAKSGNKTLDTMARSHANRTGKQWFRNDGSTAHLCVFDPMTGALKSPCTGTPQGLSANSTWARGQAWAIYGFTMAYRYTQDPSYLSYAETATKFYMDALAQGSGTTLIPMWDFNATAPENYSDTSAAAITASALLELSVFTKNASYREAAVHIISELAAYSVSSSVSDAVLSHNQHDCSAANCTIIESDYYLYEAIRRFAGDFPPESKTQF